MIKSLIEKKIENIGIIYNFSKQAVIISGFLFTLNYFFVGAKFYPFLLENTLSIMYGIFCTILFVYLVSMSIIVARKYIKDFGMYLLLFFSLLVYILSLTTLFI